MNKVLNSVIVGLILIVIVALFLVMGQAINSFNENQKVTEYKNSKRESLEHIDPYLNNLSDDDKYIAKFCYDYYKDKFNSATSITEADDVAYNVHRVVSLAKDCSKSSIEELRKMKDEIDETQRQEKMMHEFSKELKDIVN